MYHDIALIEKPLDTGIWKSEVMDLIESMRSDNVLPLEVENPAGNSLAIGFITYQAADELNFFYTGIKQEIGMILADMQKENDLGIYKIRGFDVYLSRKAPEIEEA